MSIELEIRLARTEQKLDAVLAKLDSILSQKPSKPAYTTTEFAELTGKAAFTIRQHCNNGRLCGVKDDSGDWHIPHEELLRYQREGLRGGGPRKHFDRARLVAGK